MSKNDDQLREKLKDINHFMKHRGINFDLQSKIRKYIDKFGFETVERFLDSSLSLSIQVSSNNHESCDKCFY